MPILRLFISKIFQAIRYKFFGTANDGAVLTCEGARRPVKSLRLRESSGSSWVSVDVKSVVEEWIKKPRRNFGLQVVVKDARRRSRRRRREYDALGIVDGYDCCNGDNSCK